MAPPVGVAQAGTAGTRHAAATGPAAPAARSSRGRVLRRTLLAVLLLAVAASAWLAFRGVQVASALGAAATEVRALEASVADGDLDAAAVHLPDLRSHAAAALAGTEDPVWRAASVLPGLGTQLRAVTAVTRALDLVAGDVVPALAEVASLVDPEALAPVDGAVDLGPLVAARPAIAAAAAAAAEADALVRGIPDRGLVAPLATAVQEVRGPVGDAARLLSGAEEAVTLLPPMLGADGPRDYLLLVLNPAELRKGGGIVASVAVLHADAGRVELQEYVASQALAGPGRSGATLGADEVAVHGPLLGSIMQNATMTPDFPRAAEIAVELWRDADGRPVDGVLAVEPAALAHLLEATGPVTTPDGTVLDADGVVRALLHDSYARYPDPDDADAFFGDAAAAVFDRLLTGPADATRLGGALGAAVAERRVAVWSAHEAEQEVLAASPAGGAFFGAGAAHDAGVFLDDGTGTKLGYFLETDVRITCQEAASDGGSARATVAVVLTSTVPADPSVLPPYMRFYGAPELSDGVVTTNLTVYGPVGGGVADLRRGAAALGAARAEEAGRQAAVVPVVLAPGESVTVEAAVDLPPGQTALGAWRTPGLDGVGLVPAERC
ncbi:DUF4012 domain-containing protein [Actinotalea sp. JY-7876]|uniref:DUF4012 domain-containing protein n=3 Tax=unclassified Actinotalea TaxID=2638618 RepID=UPI0015F70BF6|nr:DUF4012 domain-containing protein [Actinotalea sp. JY-7876]